jgi:pyruvate,water dikinase
VDGQNSGEDFKDLVVQRKEEMERCEHAILPDVIYGNTPPPVIDQSDAKLKGTPTSRGYYTGKTKVVRGINDFRKLDQGDVLVIPYSDVGWIPLFAKAGAVIAESGGMLSHSSIIAREYGIPAVVSVSGALQLNDDLMVSVDGYKGEVHVHG